MDVAMAHYNACDALGLSAAEQLAISIEVGDDVEGRFSVRSFARRGSWRVTLGRLSHAQRLYERLLDGGGGLCVVGSVRKKRAWRSPVCRSRGSRISKWGARLLLAGFRVFALRGHINEMPRMTTSTGFAVRLSGCEPYERVYDPSFQHFASSLIIASAFASPL